MVKKSAARMKTYKGEHQADLPPIEEVFEDAKRMFVMTVDTQIKTARRVDNLMNIRDFCMKFWDDEDQFEVQECYTLDYYKKMQQLSIDTYTRIKEIAETFELVDFRAIEIKDYFADIIPSVDSISTKQELCEAALIFMSVQPYGSKLIQMHQLMQDECAKRNILDEEDIKEDINE